MQKLTSHITTLCQEVILPLLPIVISLTYMHCRVQELSSVDYLTVQNFAISSISMIYDVAILALISHVICLGRKTAGYVLLAVLTLVWVMCNIVYATYFHSYIPLSVISEMHSTESLNMTKYITGAMAVADVIPLLAFAASMYVAKKKILPRGLTIAKTYLAVIVVLSLYFCTKASFMPGCDILSAMPSRTIWHAGFVRGEIMPMLLRDSASKELTDAERMSIRKYIEKRKAENRVMINNVFFEDRLCQRKNLIFIIAESYLACTNREIIDGKEVTPFLNKMRTLSTTICNDSVKDNVGVGGSSDGQYIFMTGLLPLRDQIAVAAMEGKTLPAIPNILKKYGYMTAMTNPSEEDMWRQKDVCPVYGIDMHKSNISKNRSYMWDSEIADYAIKNEGELKSPFCHVIITLSTHGPYNAAHPEYNVCQCYPKKKPKGMSAEYFNYLQQCHFMDHALEKYIESLKKRGLYENSVIVIASDHGWQEDATPLPKKEDASRLSFMVLNAPEGMEYHKGPMNQLDIMPTVMDILKVSENEWRGLGLSILRNKTMRNSIDEEAWRVSDDILKGNYFGKAK